MASLVHHHHLAGAAVMLNPYATPFIYTPTHYYAPPCDPCFQPAHFFQPSPQQQLQPLPSCCTPVYYTTYTYLPPLKPTLTLLGDSAKVFGDGGAFGMPPPIPVQEISIEHNAVTPFNKMKEPPVRRRRSTRKIMGWVRMARFDDGGGARNMVTVRSMEFDRSIAVGETRSTVMIRNTPSRLSRAELMRMLDGHCAAINETADDSTVLSAYDFLYLPIDFKNSCSRGYAFVNFTTPDAAHRLYQSFNGYKWDLFGSSKIIHVCYARIQGKEALMKHFSYSMFECKTDEFLPVELSPPRDGLTSLPVPLALGRRVGLRA